MKKKLVIIVVSTIVILFGGFALWYFCFNKESDNDKFAKEYDTVTSDNVLIKLNDFLKNVHFNIDNFSRECKNIESSNILLEINATLEDGSITTYKVPLSLNGTCS